MSGMVELTGDDRIVMRSVDDSPVVLSVVSRSLSGCTVTLYSAVCCILMHLLHPGQVDNQDNHVKLRDGGDQPTVAAAVSGRHRLLDPWPISALKRTALGCSRRSHMLTIGRESTMASVKVVLPSTTTLEEKGLRSLRRRVLIICACEGSIQGKPTSRSR